MKPPRLLVAGLLVFAPLLVACGSSSSTKASSPATVATTTTAPDTDASQTPDADATTATDPGADATASAADSDADSDSDADGDADAADATKSCDADALKADADATLPAGFPTVSGFVGISKVTQGDTVAVKGTIPGGPDDLPTVRDNGIKLLVADGYKEGDHDQEEGAEADGDFTGPHNGNINVRNLCKGHLVITYTLNN